MMTSSVGIFSVLGISLSFLTIIILNFVDIKSFLSSENCLNDASTSESNVLLPVISYQTS